MAREQQGDNSARSDDAQLWCGQFQSLNNCKQVTWVSKSIRRKTWRWRCHLTMIITIIAGQHYWSTWPKIILENKKIYNVSCSNDNDWRLLNYRCLTRRKTLNVRIECEMPKSATSHQYAWIHFFILWNFDQKCMRIGKTPVQVLSWNLSCQYVALFCVDNDHSKIF